MSKSVIVGGNFIATSGTTRYNRLSCNGSSSIENRTQVPIYSAGTFSGLKLRVTNNGADGTITAGFRKNGVTGSNSVSITAGATGLFEDTTNTDTVASGDLVNFIASQTGTTGTLAGKSSIAFSATTGTAILYEIGSANFFEDTVTTVNHALGGGSISTNIAEANVKSLVKTAGTFRNASWYVSQNFRTVTTTLRFRKNGANTAISIAVTAGATGLFQDASNTETVVDADQVNWQMTSSPAETNNLAGEFAAIEFISTNNTFQNISGVNATTTFVNENVTEYTTIGAYVATAASETDVETKLSFGASVTNLSAYIVTNTATTNGSVTVRKNNADTALTVVITAATTGFFQDNTNTVGFGSADTIDYKIVTGATNPTGYGPVGCLFTTTNSSIKSINGLIRASVKSINSLAIATVKSWNGLA